MIDVMLGNSGCKSILAIVAHPDDEILGLGATIKKMTELGIRANVIILGEGLTSRKETRNRTNKTDLTFLKENSRNAIKIIGYSNVEFCDFPDNRFDSLNILDIIKKIEKYIDKYHPDTIFTHHFGDLNIDHQITFRSVITACRPIENNFVNNIYCFETPSSTEWNFSNENTSFKPNVFVDIEKTLKYKLEAMNCYLTESRKFPHPRSNESLKIIAKRWGSVIGVNAAEAFELIRGIVRE